jgi:restriction endonuclease S subunit
MQNLSDVLKIKNGKDYKKFSEGEIPVYGSGGVIAYIDKFAYNKPSVLIPRKGSIDKLYYTEQPFWTVDTIFYTEINDEIINPKFVYYYLQTQHLERLNTGGGVPSLTQGVLNKIEIPVPYPNDIEKSLKEQQRIVDILDRFDALCNDMTIGLPAEIATRQKQYEYYRDKLLTFKEKQV